MTAAEDRLAEIEALAAAATKGPWTFTAVMHSQADGVGIPYVESQTGWPAMCQRSPDAAFIAAARTDVPALTAAVRAVLTYADRCDLVWRAGYEDSDLKVTHRQVAEELRDLIAAALVVKP